jgi:hypothetical protein
MQTLSQDKVSYWWGHMKRQIQSGQSIAQYCLLSGISKDTFYCWRKKLAARPMGSSREIFEAKSPSFVPVHIERASVDANKVSEDLLSDPKWLGEFAAAMIRGLR